MTTTELSAETRGQILDAAWHRVHEHGASAISVKDIAADAGVSRQLVYFHYGNPAGLLTPLARHRDEQSGFAATVAKSHDEEPIAAIEHVLRAWCAYLPAILLVALRLGVWVVP